MYETVIMQLNMMGSRGVPKSNCVSKCLASLEPPPFITLAEVRLYVAKQRSTLFTVAVQNVNVYCVQRPIITTLRLQNVDFKNDADTSHRQVQTTKPQQYFKKFYNYKHCTKCLKSVLFERKRTVDERKIDVLSTMLCNVYPTLPIYFKLSSCKNTRLII